jgi:hypothetical protein
MCVCVRESEREREVKDLIHVRLHVGEVLQDIRVTKLSRLYNYRII